MSKYIDAEKLIAEIERFSATEYGGNTLGDDIANGALDYVLEEIIPSLQREQADQTECVWIHKKYNREYRIVSDNARLKNSNGEWIDCVIYAPLYENEFEMFAREKDSFYKEFEKK